MLLAPIPRLRLERASTWEGVLEYKWIIHLSLSQLKLLSWIDLCMQLNVKLLLKYKHQCERNPWTTLSWSFRWPTISPVHIRYPHHLSTNAFVFSGTPPWNGSASIKCPVHQSFRLNITWNYNHNTRKQRKKIILQQIKQLLDSGLGDIKTTN